MHSFHTAPNIGDRFRVSSSMGGSFDVRLKGYVSGVALLAVDSPRNPDWHGYRFSRPLADLRAIPVAWQVRTRVGTTTGEPDDYLVWGRYSSPDEADEARAYVERVYPTCCPTAVAQIEI